MAEELKEIIDKKNIWKETRIPEYSFFVLFLTLSVVMFVYHEPWYDEIQAWMVASDASLWEMIFVLPHYEGHPPVWTLLLAIFAKTGVPMEIGLRIPTLLFSAIATWFVMFKAPFHKWIRCLIPFSYFLFYQYTVICRPYSLMYLGFVLAAYFYKKRNEKPVRFLASLFLLCVSSAYGILFAGVICLVWTIEIILELKGKTFGSKALKDRRTWALLVMLVAAVGLLAIIWPADNAFAQVRAVDFSRIRCLIYSFLILPADALLSDIALTGRLQQFDYLIRFEYAIVLCALVSVALYVVILVFAHIYKKKALFVFPYVAFAAYAALGYFYNHHIGIVPLFLLFFIWCAIADKPKEIVLPVFLQKLEKSMAGLGKKTGYFFVILCLAMSLFWTIIAVKNDIKLPVWYAKGLAEMIDEYGLSQYKVVNQWTYEALEKEVSTTDPVQNVNGGFVVSTEIPQLNAADYQHFVKMCNFVDILAYSENGENYILNFNNGDDNNRYVNHDMLSQEESLVYLSEFGEQGYPEVIIGDSEIVGMFGLDASEYRYYPVYAFICYRINKYNAIYARSFVYVREDIFETRDDWPIYEQVENGFQE